MWRAQSINHSFSGSPASSSMHACHDVESKMEERKERTFTLLAHIYLLLVVHIACVKRPFY
jgi:hypothetical protein